MTTERIPFWQPVVAGAADGFLSRALGSGFPNEGELTTELERRLAEIVGVGHCVMTTSGTAALFLALADLGIGPEDEVIIPDLTFAATANAVSLTGATPVLVGVVPDTLCIDPDEMWRAITDRTRAVVPVHVSGRLARLPNELLAHLSVKGVAVVEDACEALGAYDLAVRSRAACLSFSPNKLITSGQGGCVLTDRSEVAARVRAFKDQGRVVRGTGGDDEHPLPGANFKFTDVQAALLLAQLGQLPQRMGACCDRQAFYEAELSACRHLAVYAQRPGDFPLWTDVRLGSWAAREALCAALDRSGVGYRRYWRPVHAHLPRRSNRCFSAFQTNALGRRSLWLPSAFTLTDPQLRRVVELIKEWDCEHV